MKRVGLKHIPVRAPNPLAGWEQKLHCLLLFLFLACASLVWVKLRVTNGPFAEKDWPDGLLLALATGTTLVSLSRQLPAQNVVLAAVVIGAAGGAAETLGAIVGIPFGPFVYNPANIGRLIFYPLPWTVPLIWVVAILNARGVGRLMLRRYRLRPYYGFWLMGVTVLLVVLFELSFEPYATVAKQYWSWKPTRISSNWYGTPWTDFLGWAMTTLLTLLFVTPALINKSPTKRPPSYSPLVVWETLNFIFLATTLKSELWWATGLIAAQMLVVPALSAFGTWGKAGPVGAETGQRFGDGILEHKRD
jgi:uncharacterized membrane protein